MQIVDEADVLIINAVLQSTEISSAFSKTCIIFFLCIVVYLVHGFVIQKHNLKYAKFIPHVNYVSML